MKKFDYLTGEYYSNCCIEAIKAKIRNPKVKLYFCKPQKGQMFHFMWEDENASYDFSDEGNDELKWFQCLLFCGRIRRFEKGFANKYSQFRNTHKRQTKWTFCKRREMKSGQPTTRAAQA